MERPPPKPIPTHLYHGTAGRWLKNILRVGIEPRGDRPARDNWRHTVGSNRRIVYLTDSYAPYFAHHACSSNRDEQAAIIEVALDRLDPDRLYPDEDFLEQASRGNDDDTRSMLERTLAYRRRQFTFDRYTPTGHPDYALWWHASLAGLGTCSYRGTIPVAAITRVVTYPRERNLRLRFIWDPTITLMNQQIVGDRYRILTAKLFAGEFTDPRTLPCPEDGGDPQAMLEARSTALPPIEGWRVEPINP